MQYFSLYDPNGKHDVTHLQKYRDKFASYTKSWKLDTRFRNRFVCIQKPDNKIQPVSFGMIEREKGKKATQKYMSNEWKTTQMLNINGETIRMDETNSFIFLWCLSIDLDSRSVQFDHLHKSAACYWNYFNSCNRFFSSLFSSMVFFPNVCHLFSCWLLYQYSFVVFVFVLWFFFSYPKCVSLFNGRVRCVHFRFMFCCACM